MLPPVVVTVAVPRLILIISTLLFRRAASPAAGLAVVIAAGRPTSFTCMIFVFDLLLLCFNYYVHLLLAGRRRSPLRVLLLVFLLFLFFLGLLTLSLLNTFFLFPLLDFLCQNINQDELLLLV